MPAKKTFALYAIMERGERSFWTRIGTAYANRDGSFNLFFDALPVNGRVNLREVPAPVPDTATVHPLADPET